MIDSLAENFKITFNDIRIHSANVCIFKNPFSVAVSDTSEKEFKWN
jgi:hypothetical protein